MFLNSGEFFSLNLPNSFFPRPPSFSPFILPNSLDRSQKDLQARRLMLDSASFPLALHRFPGSCSCLTGGKGLALPLLLLSCRADEKDRSLKDTVTLLTDICAPFHRSSVTLKQRARAAHSPNLVITDLNQPVGKKPHHAPSCSLPEEAAASFLPFFFI